MLGLIVGCFAPDCLVVSCLSKSPIIMLTVFVPASPHNSPFLIFSAFFCKQSSPAFTSCPCSLVSLSLCSSLCYFYFFLAPCLLHSVLIRTLNNSHLSLTPLLPRATLTFPHLWSFFCLHLFTLLQDIFLFYLLFFSDIVLFPLMFPRHTSIPTFLSLSQFSSRLHHCSLCFQVYCSQHAHTFSICITRERVIEMERFVELSFYLFFFSALDSATPHCINVAAECLCASIKQYKWIWKRMVGC